MQIPLYNAQNIIKVYSKQIYQGKILDKTNFYTQKNSKDNVTLSNNGKRQIIIETVAQNMVAQIITQGPQTKEQKEIILQIEKEFGKKINYSKNKNQLTYTQIDETGKQIINTLSTKEAESILNKMSELAEKIAENNMEL